MVWSRLGTDQLPPRDDVRALHFSDPGDVLNLVADEVGPPTGVCVLEDTVVGVAGWSRISMERQYEAVTERAAAFVAGAMNYLRITGPDACQVLDMLTPVDMTKLGVGRGKFVLFTTPAGTVDNEAVVLRLAEDEYVLSCGGPKKGLSWLPEALAAHPRATVEDAGVGCFNIKGPKRLEAMSELVEPQDRARIAELRPFQACQARTPDGLPVWIVKTLIGMEMWGDGEALNQSWRRILKQPDLITPCGWDLLDVFRLECRDMVFGVYPIELHGGTTLWEAGFSAMAEQAKQRDFIGRSALLQGRDDRRLWLAGLVPNGPAAEVPALGQEAFAQNGEFAGYITTSAFSPRYGRPLAFAHLKPGCRPGQSLTLKAGGGTWTVTALPFPAPDALDAAGGVDG